MNPGSGRFDGRTASGSVRRSRLVGIRGIFPDEIHAPLMCERHWARSGCRSAIVANSRLHRCRDRGSITVAFHFFDKTSIGSAERGAEHRPHPHHPRRRCAQSGSHRRRVRSRAGRGYRPSGARRRERILAGRRRHRVGWRDSYASKDRHGFEGDRSGGIPFATTAPPTSGRSVSTTSRTWQPR